MKNELESSPAEAPTLESRRQSLVDWWMELEMSGDAGATNWEVLDVLRDCVTSCLGHDPPDIDRAESYTAQAMLLVGGFCKH